MSDLPNPPQAPNAQTRREHNASKAEPESSLVALQERLGTLLIFILRLVGNVRSNDSDEAQANGLADLVHRLVRCFHFEPSTRNTYLRHRVEHTAGQGLGVCVEDGSDQEV